MTWVDWVSVAIVASWVAIGCYEARRGNWGQAGWAVFWVLLMTWWLL